MKQDVKQKIKSASRWQNILKMEQDVKQYVK